MIFAIKNKSSPLTKGWGVGSDIYSYIINRPISNPEKLILPWITLVVESTNRPFLGKGVIVLHKRAVNSKGAIALFTKTLKEKTSIVFEDAWLD